MRLRVPGYNLQSLKPEQRKGIGTHCLSNYRPLITLLVIIVCYYIEFPKRFLRVYTGIESRNELIIPSGLLQGP